MSLHRIVEYVFFFVILVGSGYLVWQVLSPLITALALSLIIVTICYPLYELVLQHVYRNNKSLAAGVTTLIAVFLVVLPLVFISSVFVRELVSFYQTLGAGSELPIDRYVSDIELAVQEFIPGFSIDLTEQIRLSAEWFVGNIGRIFAGTVSTVFVVLISLFGAFYFFRDGREFVRLLIKVSPLSDRDDEAILARLAVAVRSVATGVLLVSLLQGTLAALGFTIFGIERAVLWGAVGAILAMLPGIGTPAIMVPGILYLFFAGAVGPAIGLLVWMVVTIVVVDNIISPHLMSRGNNLHPFIVLTAVLGGISTFGPIGFIVGPVVVTLFLALLEIYNQYIMDTGRPRTRS